jgi:hypothetical protein
MCTGIRVQKNSDSALDFYSIHSPSPENGPIKSNTKNTKPVIKRSYKSKARLLEWLAGRNKGAGEDHPRPIATPVARMRARPSPWGSLNMPETTLGENNEFK